MRALLGVVAALPLAAAFSFHLDNRTVTECGNAQINFTAGTPPYLITAIPEFSTAYNFTVPESAVTSSTGGIVSVNVPVYLAAGKKTVFVMSDATDFGTGGVSPLVTVGARAGGAAACSLVNENPPFTFAIYPENNTLQQCKSIAFTWEGGMKGAVRLVGVIPGGMVMMTDPSTSREISYPVKIQAGSQLLYSAWDDAGNMGGTSMLQTVVSSGDTSCLSDDGSVLSATPVVWNPTPTSTAGNSSTTKHGVVTVIATKTALPAGAAGLTTGAIAGIVVGVIIAVLILQAILVWFCCRRQVATYFANRKKKREHYKNGGRVDLYEPRPGESLAAAGVGMSGIRHSRGEDDLSAISPFIGGAGGSDGYHSDSYHAPFSDSPRISTYSTPGMGSSPLVGALPAGASAGIPPSSYPSASQNTSAYPSTHTFGAASMSASSIPGRAGPLPPKLSMALQNPDNDFYDDHAPPPSTIRRHEDAGPITPVDARHPSIEDLPPTYNPQWETDSNR